MRLNPSWEKCGQQSKSNDQNKSLHAYFKFDHFKTPNNRWRKQLMMPTIMLKNRVS